MQRDVMKVLEEIGSSQKDFSLAAYMEQDKILTDCY